MKEPGDDNSDVSAPDCRLRYNEDIQTFATLSD
jgi:hypothetical protein